MDSAKKKIPDLALIGDPIEWFEAMAENAVAVQIQTLRRILEQNCETEYLRKWLGEEFRVNDLEASELESLYRNSVPLATHADFEPYIQRIADGDTNPILTQKPITHLSITTGTTEGRQKYVPYNMEYQKICRISKLVESTFQSRYYPTKEGGKILAFVYCNSKLPKTKGGLTVGPVSTHLSISVVEDNRFSVNCSPWEIVSMGAEHKQLTYCHFLLGLFYSEKVEIIFSTFAHNMVLVLASFEEIWKDLCHDLREGTLSSRIKCPKMRKIVLDIITPNPSLASMIEDKCQVLKNLGWFGLIPELWPNAKYIRCIATGSMKLYAKQLRHYLKDLPLVCNNYMASESFVGVNASPYVDPEDIGFSVAPYASYFEFIRLHKKKMQVLTNISVGDNYAESKPIPLSQIKVGQEYEIVLTTFTGLYRYRLGDIVEVIGYHKETPKLKFKCRSKVGLSVNVDKTTEKDIEIVVERGSELLSNKTKAEMVDYTSHADLENQPGNYIIYWEIKGDVNSEDYNKVLQECCTEMDKLFVDIGYTVSRRKRSIGPLVLSIVERGTFKRVFDCYVKNGGNVGQYKTPRCTNNNVILGVLKTFTFKSFHSTAYGT